MRNDEIASLLRKAVASRDCIEIAQVAGTGGDAQRAFGRPVFFESIGDGEMFYLAFEGGRVISAKPSAVESITTHP